MDVTILLGSKSDMPIAEKCTKILDHFGLYFPDGGFVDTAQLCKFYLTSNYITKSYKK